MNDSVNLALKQKPSERQLKWYRTGYYGLISFGIPTFNMKEYGDGCSPATMFSPENPDMNTDNWADFALKGGMKGLVLNVKQCDGFCLWQTEQTDYSVKSSNWKEGKGDLVAELALSCRKAGLKFGIQFSLWDRHDKRYGAGDEYNNYIIALLTELLTSYGDIFYIRLDPTVGADEWKNQAIDYGSLFTLIRKLQPDAVIAFAGPDVRWCGNERAQFRDSEWASLPAYLGIKEDGTEAKPKNKKPLSLVSEDLGSEKAIKGEDEFMFYPTDLCFPMRSHWYYQSDDKYTVKTKDKLIKAYIGSVGNNGCMMLGIAPDRQGNFGENDMQILTAFGHDLKLYFSYNLLSDKITASASSEDGNNNVNNIRSDDETYWKPADKDKHPSVILNNPEEEPFDKIVLMENISNGQSVSSFEISVEENNKKIKKIFSGNTIGYKRICSVSPTKAKKIIIEFKEYRKTPEITYLSVN